MLDQLHYDIENSVCIHCIDFVECNFIELIKGLHPVTTGNKLRDE